MATWLDTTFFGFDNSILGFWHSLAEVAGGFFTPFMNVISFFGAKGLCMIAISVILCLFKRTRKCGVAALIGILFGFITTNLIIKNLVARARPYTRAEYQGWWQLVGAPTESEYSFPSGHTTVATDALVAMFIVSKKKSVSWLLLLAPVLMGISRNYLMVHYPTDVIGGIIVGSIAAVCSALLINYLYRLMERHADNKFCKFILNACIIDLFKRKTPVPLAEDAQGDTETDAQNETEDEPRDNNE